MQTRNFVDGLGPIIFPTRPPKKTLKNANVAYGFGVAKGFGDWGVGSGAWAEGRGPKPYPGSNGSEPGPSPRPNEVAPELPH